MRYKTSLDLPKKRIVYGMIASYDAYVAYLKDAKANILLGSPVPGEKVQGGSGNVTERKAERLLQIDNSFKARAVNAIDAAKELLAVDIENEQLRRKIVNAIWRSCISPRNYPYRGGLWISRSDFYRRKNDFIQDIARNMML